jgi:ABC-2 type transport system permease protein
MSIRRVLVLMKKDIKHCLMGFFFIFSVIGPLLVTLLVNLVFGSIFSGKPKLGITYESSSEIVESIKRVNYIIVSEYSTEEKLKQAVRIGSSDVGVVFVKDFDAKIKKGELTKLTAYIWGESHLKNRAIVSSAILQHIRAFSGVKNPVDITLVSLGEKVNTPWQDRFLALIVLLAIFIGGFTIPAALLVEEKQKYTMGAITTTPLTQREIFAAKGLVGIMVSVIVGTLILVLNQAFNTQLPFIILILWLGAIMAACFGLIVGAFIKEIASLHTVIKALGLIIYGPGIVAIFPQIPAWVGKMFPTYYVMNPLLEISRKGGAWSTVYGDILILVGILIVLILIVITIANKVQQQEA